ncbi:MAG: DUF4160 domain-containing protein [Bacteroidota bacterium]|nr:DUF4160 domain-containing protein [Bacteroidota bacterium]
MPEISRFYGIVIRMFYEDHLPAHFHAEYEEFEALIDIARQMVFAGSLPPRALGMVIEWTTIHHGELIGIWDDIHNFKPAGKIAPLP